MHQAVQRNELDYPVKPDNDKFISQSQYFWRQSFIIEQSHGKEECSMAKPMTKSQITDHIAKKAEIKKVQAAMILDEIAKLAYKEAKNSFTLPGIGKIVLVQRKARKGRNPQTGEAIKIPAKKVVKFRVAKAAKDAILGKK
jgi:DNA-binding protein HU-beta